MADDTTKRDSLAKDRTDLANERTFLSYIRTSLAFILAGGFIIRFSQGNTENVIAVISILIGVVVFFIGGNRFRVYRERITRH